MGTTSLCFIEARERWGLSSPLSPSDAEVGICVWLKAALPHSALVILTCVRWGSSAPHHILKTPGVEESSVLISNSLLPFSGVSLLWVVGGDSASHWILLTPTAFFCWVEDGRPTLGSDPQMLPWLAGETVPPACTGLGRKIVPLLGTILTRWRGHSTVVCFPGLAGWGRNTDTPWTALRPRGRWQQFFCGCLAWVRWLLLKRSFCSLRPSLPKSFDRDKRLSQIYCLP